MDAKELMIGDFVHCITDNVNHKIDSFGTDYRIETEGHPYYVVNGQYNVINDIEPILLTPEILEKNGWKREFDKVDYMVKYDINQDSKNCWMMWAINDHNLDIQRQDTKLESYNLKAQMVVIPCDYVHQLQHALRLCGITKEIQL